MEFTGQVVFLTAFLVMLISQAAKMIIATIKNRKLEFMHVFELSGMPSSHTATVTALAIGVYFAEGFSVLFAVMIMLFGFVVSEVIYDKMSISMHAKILNEVRFYLKEKGYKAKKHPIIMEKKMREEWGHTPFEIISGFILGAVITLIIVAI